MEQFSVGLGEKLASFLIWAANPISQLLLFPLLGCLLISGLKPGNLPRIRFYAVFFSALTLLVSVLMLTGLPEGVRKAAPFLGQYIALETAAPPQFSLPADQYKWITIQYGEYQSLSVNWNVGVDGLSMPLIILSSALFLAATLWGLTRKEKAREFYALLLLLQVGIGGVFVSLDFILFYLFWELMLLPMYFLIAGFGKERVAAQKAAIKFFLFTMGGSVFFLISAIAMKVLSNVYSFSIIEICLAAIDPAKMGYLPLALRTMMFVGLLLAFAVKIPIFPLHTWLPDAHTEAPTEISVILAGIMLKTGAYAMLRMLYFAFPDVGYVIGPIIATCAVISIVYGAAITLAQTDFKRMVAYSSISHMGFIVLGISAMNVDATVGACFHMVGHGLIIATLFFLSGVLERRYGTRDLRQISGLLKLAPGYSPFLVLAAAAGMGFPFLIGFWGELMVLKGTFYNNPNWESVHVGPLDASSYLQILAVVACLGILTSAVYMLRMLVKVLGGEAPVLAQSNFDEKLPALAQPVMLPGTQPKSAEQALAWAGISGSPTAASYKLEADDAAAAQAAAELDAGHSLGGSAAAELTPWRGLRSNEALVLIPLALAIILFGLQPSGLFASASTMAANLMQYYMAF